MNEPNYYAIIPANIRYAKDLSMFQKLLYGEITALTQKDGFCWAGNKYFANLYDKNPEWISRIFSDMQKKGYLEINIDQSKGNLRKIYIGELKKVRSTVVRGPIVEKNNTIEQKDKGYGTKRQDPIIEKDKHNNTRVNNIINNNISKDILQEKPESSENSYIENGVEKFGNKKINTLLLFLCKSIGIDEFKETQKQQRFYGKHFLNYIDNKIGKYEFVKRLNGILEDEFKSKNSNSIKYLYNEIKSFIHSPLIENKKNIDTGIVLTDMEF